MHYLRRGDYRYRQKSVRWFQTITVLDCEDLRGSLRSIGNVLCKDNAQ
jgi:hypothetical protein